MLIAVAKGGAKLQEIARMAHVSDAQASRILTKLVRAGMLVRIPARWVLSEQHASETPER